MITNKIPSIWTGMYAQLPLHEALQVLASQGWRSVEISTEHLSEMTTSAVATKQLDLVLDICVNQNLITLQAQGSLVANIAHASEQRRREAVEQLKRELTFASYLGARNLVIRPGIYQRAATRSERKRMTQYNVKNLRELGNHAAELNITIALENLPRRVYATSEDLLSLIEAIDHEAVRVAFNSAHANLTPDLDIADAVRDFGDLLICTRLSDNDGSSSKHVIPGRGTIDWAKVMQSLAEVNFSGTVNLEIPGDRHSNLELRDLNSRHAHSVAKLLVQLSESGD